MQGKREDVEIFELLGRRSPESGPPPVIAPYERALDAYLGRDFAGALAHLAGLADDPPSRVLAARCRAFLAAPPPPDWNGVFTATTK